MIKSVYAQVNQGRVDLGFTPPTITSILTFGIRAFFIISGIIALIYLLLGAMAWITSGGEKEGVQKAQQKIQAAVIGLILLVAVIGLVVIIEQVIFSQKFCLGISCDIVFPQLLH